MKFIKNVIIGAIIGGGMILPGVSGGVLAVVFGIYEDMLDAVANFFKDIKKNALFLGPIILGLVLGVFLFGKVLFFVFENYPIEAKYTFMGLILGGVPILVKEIKVKGKGKGKANPALLIVSFLIAITLFVLGKDTFNINFSGQIDNSVLSFVLLFLTGLIFVAGKIIPGISSSFLLMLIGMYQFILNILNNPFGLSIGEYMQIIPFLLGVLGGAVVLIKIIRYLLKKHFAGTYSVIIGFVIGSITAIYPGFSLDYHGFIGIILFVLAMIISYLFSLKSLKDTKEH